MSLEICQHLLTVSPTPSRVPATRIASGGCNGAVVGQRFGRRGCSRGFPSVLKSANSQSCLARDCRKSKGHPGAGSTQRAEGLKRSWDRRCRAFSRPNASMSDPSSQLLQLHYIPAPSTSTISSHSTRIYSPRSIQNTQGSAQ